MRTLNVHETKTHFSRLLVDVEAGETVTIARAGKPVARLVPIGGGEPEPKRVFGMRDGQDEELLAIFDNWTDEQQAELEALFYGPITSPDP